MATNTPETYTVCLRDGKRFFAPQRQCARTSKCYFEHIFRESGARAKEIWSPWMVHPVRVQQRGSHGLHSILGEASVQRAHQVRSTRSFRGMPLNLLLHWHIVLLLSGRVVSDSGRNSQAQCAICRFGTHLTRYHVAAYVG